MPRLDVASIPATVSSTVPQLSRTAFGKFGSYTIPVNEIYLKVDSAGTHSNFVFTVESSFDGVSWISILGAVNVTSGAYTINSNGLTCTSAVAIAGITLTLAEIRPIFIRMGISGNGSGGSGYVIIPGEQDTFQASGGDASAAQATANTALANAAAAQSTANSASSGLSTHIADTNNPHGMPAASQSVAGTMSASDKTKLDSLSLAANRLHWEGDGYDGAAAALTGALVNDINLFTNVTLSGDVTPRTGQQAAIIRCSGTLNLNSFNIDATGLGGLRGTVGAAGTAGTILGNGGAGGAAAAGSASTWMTSTGSAPAAGTGGAAPGLSSVGNTGTNAAAPSGTFLAGAGGGGGSAGSTAANTGGAGGNGSTSTIGTRGPAKPNAWVQCPEIFASLSAFNTTQLGNVGAGGGSGGGGGGAPGTATVAGLIGSTGRLGGNGGGLLFVAARAITGTGSIKCNGAAGVSTPALTGAPPGSNLPGFGASGAGGGGNGGFLSVRTTSLGGGVTLSANGGAGGAGGPGSLGNGTGANGGAGGAGSAGLAGIIDLVIL